MKRLALRFPDLSDETGTHLLPIRDEFNSNPTLWNDRIEADRSLSA